METKQRIVAQMKSDIAGANQGYTPAISLGSGLSQAQIDSGVPISTNINKSISARNRAGVEAIAGIQGLLQKGNLELNKPLFDAGFFTPESLSTDHKTFMKQISSVQKQLDLISKGTNMNLTLELSGPKTMEELKRMNVKDLAGLNYQFHIKGNMPNGDNFIRLPFGTGTTSTYGSDIRVANSGSILESSDLGDFPRRNKALQGATFMTFNEAVMSNIFKTLKGKQFNQDNPFDRFRDLDKTLKTMFEETYSSAKRSSSRQTSTISSIHDIFALSDVINTKLTGKSSRGYDLRDFQTTFDDFASNLSNPDSPHYKLVGGITQADADLYPKAVTQSGGKYVLKSPAAGALDQYNNLIAKKIMEFSSGSHRSYMTGQGTVPEVFGFANQRSKIDSLTTTKALVNTIPFEASIAKAVGSLSQDGVGVKLGYESASALKEMVQTLEGKYSSVSVKHMKIVGGFDQGFMQHLMKTHGGGIKSYGKSFSLGNMSVGELLRAHQDYSMKATGYVPDMDDLLQSMGLPTQMLQSEGAMIPNTKVDQKLFQSMRDKVMPFDMGDRPGQTFNRLVNPGDTVTVGQKIGFFKGPNNEIIEEIMSPRAGRISFETGKDKVKAIIASVSSLLEQPSVVVGSGSKGTIQPARNDIAQQILESEAVKDLGDVKGAGFIMSNASIDKEMLNLKNLVMTDVGGGKFVAGSVAQEDFYTRAVNQTDYRRAKVAGPDRVAAQRYFKDMARFSQGIRQSGLDSGVLKTGVSDLIADFLQKNNVMFSEAKQISNALKGTSQTHIIEMLSGLGDKVYNPDRIMKIIEQSLVSSSVSPYQIASLRRSLYGQMYNLATDAVKNLHINDSRQIKFIGKVHDKLSKYNNLTKAGGSMDQYAAAIQYNATNPVDPNSNKYRNLYLNMNTALLTGEYGAARLDLDRIKRYAGMNSPEAKIARGATLMASPLLAGLPNHMLYQGTRQGLVKNFYIGDNLNQARTISESLIKLYNTDNLRGKVSREALDLEFDETIKKIGGKGINRGLGQTTIHASFKGDPKKRLLGALAEMVDLSESDRAIAHSIIHRGVFISSNDMLGLSEKGNRWTGQFLRQREKLVQAVQLTVATLQATSVGGVTDSSAIAQKALRHLIGVVGSNSRDILEKLGSEQMLTKALAYEESGIFGGVVGPTKELQSFNIKMGRTFDLLRRQFSRGMGWSSIEKSRVGKTLGNLAEEASTMFISADDYMRLYGRSHKNDKIDRFVFASKHPKLALSSEVVMRARVSDELVSGKVGVNQLVLEYMKSDTDFDANHLTAIDTNTAAGKKAAELGIKRTKKLNQDALRYYGFDIKLIQVLKKNDDLSSNFRLERLEKDLRAAEAQANHGRIKDLKQTLNAEFGPNWFKALQGTLNYSKETGIITNRLNQFNAVVLKGMENELEVIAKGGKISDKARSTASFISALNFVGEAKIRAFKSGAAGQSAKATNMTDLLNRIISPSKRGDNKLFNVAGFTDEMSEAFMDTFGFDVSSYINGKDGKNNIELLRAKFGAEHTDELLNRVATDTKAGRKTYVLNAGKQAVFDEAFGHFFSKGEGFRYLEEDRIRGAVKGAMEIVALAESNPEGPLAHTMKIAGRASSKMGGAEMIPFINKGMAGTIDAQRASSFVDQAIFGGVLNFTTSDIPSAEAQARGATIQVEQASAGVLDSITTTTKLAKAGPEDIMKGNWFSKLAGGLKGGIAGAVIFGAGAAVGATFGSGGLQPLSPIPQGHELGSINQLPAPPTYLRDESGFTTRSRISGNQRDMSYLSSYANSAGRDANITIQDRSLSESRYVQNYEQRASGRF